MGLIDYVPVREATIAILRDYHDQQWKAQQGKERISHINDKMFSMQRASSSTPVQGGGSKAEESLCGLIDRKQVAEYGYHRAKKYLNEFEPCWQRLNEEERYLLTERYVESRNDSDRRAWVERCRQKLNIEKSEIYDRSSAALNRLTKLIWW